MNIIFATNFRVGQTGEFAHIALTRMGMNLISLTPTQDAPDDWIKVAPDLDIVEFVESLDEKPDLFLYVESSTGTPFLPRGIDKLKIPTAAWLYDNYLNFRWNKEMIALFDYAFFAQLNRTNLATAYGHPQVHWLPFAADEKFHQNFHQARDIDIGYVGTITDQKKKYFADLEKSGLKVTTNDRYLSYEDIGHFYSRCKLVYNISARRDTNVRTFEAPYAGAVVVNQSWIDEGCRKIFREGVTMAYHHFDDAGAICTHLLQNEKLRQSMSLKGEQLVAAGHTYRHRMEQLLSVCDAGVTPERVQRAADYRAPLAEALTSLHRDFGWRKRGYSKLCTAFCRDTLNSIGYLLKYCLWRLREKIEKTLWEFGKAPI